MIRYSLVALFIVGRLFGIEDLSEAKVGECFSKVILPSVFEVKDEKVEIQKASKKIVVTPAVFEKMKKKVIIQPAFIDLQEVRAEFKEVKIKLPTTLSQVYFSADKDGNVPISMHMLAAAKLNGLDVKSIKVGECYNEYYTKQIFKKIQKEFVSREAFESIDIKKPEFKKSIKKIVVKPAYKKIIKTPAIYETKIISILVESAKKEWIKSDCNRDKSECATVCLKEIPAKYKTITKKILKTPPLTKIIEFPAVYKEVEVKELVSEASSSRKVMPELKSKYDVLVGLDTIKFFWLKNDKKTKSLPTGYSICRVKSKQEYKEFTKEVVSSPASVKKIKVEQKTIDLEVEKLIKDGSVATLEIPPVYENIKSKVELSPSKIVWRKVVCRADLKKRVVKDIQIALKKKGFYHYKVDGILGQGTKDALIKYQKASNLSFGAYTKESLNSLGVNF